MKRNIFDRLSFLALCAAVCAFSLSQCAPKNVRQDNLKQDPQPKEQPKQELTAAKEEKPKHADYAPLKEFCAARLKTAQEKLDLLVKAKGGAALDVIAAFDAMQNEIQTAEGKADVMANMHPDEDVRTVGMECVQTFEKFVSSFWLNRAAYEVFASIDAKKTNLDELSARLLKRVMDDFRREGVDKDAETRAKIEEKKKREVELTQEYEKNIRDDMKKIKVKPAQLEGMPQDFIDSHKAGEDGLVTLSTDDPDYFPMMNYCKDSDAKRELYKAWLSIAYPKNSEVLRELLKTRCELAKLKGYADYASLATEDKMIKNPQNAQKFIDEAAKKAQGAAKKMYARLLERKKKDYPDAKSVEIWEQHYLLNKIREAEYDYDSQEARKYFDIRKVKAGLFKVVETLYGVKISQVKDDKTLWHPDVESYDMTENGAKIAHFYFDIYPREGKVKSAAMFSLTPGIVSKQIPDGVLMANFAQPKGNEKTLMEHIDVQTFFHEFGHLLHHLFSGVKARYVYFSGTAMEWDFVETPSQLFEEWTWRPEVLKLFATDDLSAPIPEKLLDKMRKADALGRPLFASTQMFYAGLSLALYVGDFGNKSFDELQKNLFEKTAPYPYRDFMHYESGFWHLTGYASNYYTYMWSLVIAKDVDGPFAKNGYLDAKTAAKYRETILSRGGEKDAADLVKDFLGRQFSFDAFDAWLAGKD